MPGGIYSDLIEQPSDRIGLWTRVEHQVSPAQTIRADLGRNVNEAHNQGIGEFDLPERALTRKGSDGELRVGHHATVRRRFVNDFRIALGWDSAEMSSVSDARTIRVLDAFTSGGAQQQGGHRSRTLEIENELQFTARRLHQITSGVSVNGSDYDGDEYSNASGTYTFASLASFEAGQPTTFTQRVGDPTYAYSMYHFGWHIQDDFRVRRNLMINLGVRHDFQTHMRDWVNFSPRIGVSWMPSSKARTTLRASMGVFHSLLDAGTYQQTLLVNGLQQRDLVISSPGYPDPLSAGVTQAAVLPSIIRARADLEMPFTRRYTVGVDQAIGKFLRFRGTWSH
ncbi:MAG: TonB-dependent receptor domain-containing protein, partial [Vicinamibacterales bacterium]